MICHCGQCGSLLDIDGVCTGCNRPAGRPTVSKEDTRRVAGLLRDGLPLTDADRAIILIALDNV